MLIFLSLVFIFTLVLLLYNGTRPPSNLPPSPPRLPIIGNLHQLSSLPHLSLHKLSEKLGPIMFLKMGQISTIVVSSPDVAEEILKTQDHIFADRPAFKAADLLMYGQRNVSFAKYGEYWRRVKKVCVVQLLSSKKVQGFRSVREESVGRMVGRIRELCSSSDGVIDLNEVLYQFSHGTIIRAVTGGQPDGATARRFHELVDEAAALLRGFQIDDVFPSLGWIGMVTGMDKKLKELSKKWDAFLSQIVDEHKSSGDGGVVDFVDVLLSLQSDPDHGVSRDEIKTLIMDMNAAGTDTTYALMEWTMSELITNPLVMGKVKRELVDIVGHKPEITEDDLPQLRYLKATMKEVLRLHPPAPLLMPHESMEETRVHGYTVPKKTRVIINVWAIARDPRWWESQEEFSPERFLAEEEIGGGKGDYKGQDFRFLPFGSGRRSCPGIQFAMTAVELAVANLINRFDWAVLPGMKELDMAEAPGITVRRATPLRVVAKPCTF